VHSFEFDFRCRQSVTSSGAGTRPFGLVRGMS